MGKDAEKNLRDGSNKLIKAIFPNCNPAQLLSGMQKFANLVAGPCGCQDQHDWSQEHDVCCCHDPNGPAEVIHLPGQRGVPLCKADPKKVIDALFPPLPPAKGQHPGAPTAPGHPGGPPISSLIDPKSCQKCLGGPEGLQKLMHSIV